MSHQSKTAEVFSRQFGKTDTVLRHSRRNKGAISPFKSKGQSEGVQERDIYRPAVFMELEVGEFIGRTVESAAPVFHNHFRQVDGQYRQSVGSSRTASFRVRTSWNIITG